MKYFTFINQIRSKDYIFDLTDSQKKNCKLFLKSINDGHILLNSRDMCLCESEKRVLLALHDRYGLPFQSYLCENCGLIYTTPYISFESIEYYYKNFYHGIHFKTKAKDHKVIYKKSQGAKIYCLLKHKLMKKDIKILDLGCGQGSVIKEFMTAANNNNYTVKGVGLEFNEEYMTYSNTEHFELEIRQGGIDSIVKEDGYFDVVIMSHIFEHITDPKEDLTKLKKIITPDSLIYMEVPGVCNLKQSHVYKSNFIQYFTAAHIFNFNLVSLTNIMNKNGFKLIWGNEIVESVFMLGNQSISVSNNAEIIKSYLEDLIINETFYQSLNPSILKENLQIFELEDKIAFLSQELHYLIKIIQLFRRTPIYKLFKRIYSSVHHKGYFS